MLSELSGFRATRRVGLVRSGKQYERPKAPVFFFFGTLDQSGKGQLPQVGWRSVVKFALAKFAKLDGASVLP